MKIPANSGSGKHGDKIYQGGRYGQISRALVIPTNPRTPAQCLARSRLAYLASRWSQLSQPQRNAWNIAVRQHQLDKPLDPSKPLRGAQLFARINCARLMIGAPEVTLPPPKPSFGPLPVTGLTVAHTGAGLTLKLTTTGSPLAGTMLWAAPPCSQGRYGPTTVAYIGTLPPPVGGTIDITAPYTARFGAPPIGSKVFVRINQNIDGWEDVPHQFSAIVPVAS